MDTTASGAQLQPDDAAQIRATIAPWRQACLDRDWDSLLAMCTEDIVFSGPGEPKVSGDAVRTWLENYPIIKTMEFDFERLEISGDLAAAHGSGSMLLEVDGEEVPERIDFIDVFRKGQDGTWRYSSLNFNSKIVPA
jgi:ketosteroid isomerase-like protein